MIERPMLLFALAYPIGLILLAVLSVVIISLLAKRRNRLHPTTGIIIKKELNRRIEVAINIFTNGDNGTSETKVTEPVINESYVLFIKKGNYENIIVTDKETWYQYHIGDQYTAKGSDAVGS